MSGPVTRAFFFFGFGSSRSDPWTAGRRVDFPPLHRSSPALFRPDDPMPLVASTSWYTGSGSRVPGRGRGVLGFSLNASGWSMQVVAIRESPAITPGERERRPRRCWPTEDAATTCNRGSRGGRSIKGAGLCAIHNIRCPSGQRIVW
jgi:hypothetical protein